MSRLAVSPGGCAALFAASTLVMYLTTTGGSLATTDAVVTYEVTRNLLEHGTPALLDQRLQLPELRGEDGRYYAPFGIGQSLYNIPFYLTGKLLEHVSPFQLGPPGVLTKAFVAGGSAVAAALTAAVAWMLAFRLSGSASAATVAALCLAYGSALWPYSKFGFNAPLAALLVTSGIYEIWQGTERSARRRIAGGGALLGAALLTRHEFTIAVPVVLAWTWTVSTPRRWMNPLLASIGPGVGVGIWLWYNESRFGDPFYAGHRPAFDGGGAFGLLFSTGGSLFLYSPVALLALMALPGLWQRDRRTAALLASVVASLFAFYAALEDWLGTRSYGPRYLVPLLPILLATIADLWRHTGRRARLAIVALAAFSGAVQLPGVLVDPGKANVALEHPGPVRQAERRYHWELSALRINTLAAAVQVPANIRYLSGVEVPPAVSRTRRDVPFSQQFAFSLDFWWMYGFHLGIMPRLVAVAVPLIGVTTAAWLFQRLRRSSAGLT